MKKELHDPEKEVVNTINVICRLIGNNPEIDSCRKCCLEENQDCMNIACIPSERADKMYVVFENVKYKYKSKVKE